MFITAFEGVLDLRIGEFRYVNAGHEKPFIYRKKEGYEVYKIRPGFVLAGMERLHRVLNQRCLDTDPEQTLKLVKADIDAFVGETEAFDDITMLCLAYTKKMEESL